ncbi:hypothetical protein Lepto7376_3690 [[Leptolyngbya] sp. PCC 7376]|uniref:hypothetical protein n=1 Tax=[Leptolyngbya] sp. PCC 7376 TaxID=111781 RepID=UPI00029F2675|nr:hypothetical protein [[Leptolyngbya] sp. PCC 7376]AFY39866.1 hypothetical protein Lepto7376_3690 [[Leptolyngbya] sp. PCC 7376]
MTAMKSKSKFLRGLWIFSFIVVGMSLIDVAGECSGETQEMALFSFLPLSYIAIYGYISYFHIEEENKRLQKDDQKKHAQIISLANKQKKLLAEKKEMHQQISKLKRQAQQWLGEGEQ